MTQQHDTYVSRLKIRKQTTPAESGERMTNNTVEWINSGETRSKDRFFHNLTVAGALVLCVVTLRTGAVPPLDGAADAVLTAATDHSLLDEQLGKLSFVSALFPEAVLVFGEQHPIRASIPIDEEMVTHVWSQSEPYISWHVQSLQVDAAADGEVTGIFHGYGDEKIVEISGDSAYTWLYGNLHDVFVSLGEKIRIGDQIGTTLPDSDLVLEVRRYGESINPAYLYQK